MSTDELDPLFRLRPRQRFGRMSVYRDEDESRTGIQRLLTNIAAAKRHWMSGYTNHDKFYEKVTKEFPHDD
jgi:hypothetical protein